jgi:hypothetical protein
MKVYLSGAKRFVGALQIKVSELSDFGKLGEFFLQLKKVKVSMLDALVLVGVLAVLSASHFTKSVVFLLVSYSLLFLLL